MRAVTRAVAVVAAAVTCLPGAVHAQGIRGAAQDDDGPKQHAGEGRGARGWLELGVGGGWTHLKDNGSDPGGSFALDLGGGFWLRDRVGLGVRLGGWTLEGFDFGDPREGESLSEAFALLRLRPVGRRPLTLSLEGGWVSYIVNDPAKVLREGDGLGARFGVGWDVEISRSWAVAPTLVGSWGGFHPDFGPERSFSYWSVGALVRLAWRR